MRQMQTFVGIPTPKCRKEGQQGMPKISLNRLSKGKSDLEAAGVRFLSRLEIVEFYSLERVVPIAKAR